MVAKIQDSRLSLCPPQLLETQHWRRKVFRSFFVAWFHWVNTHTLDGFISVRRLLMGARVTVWEGALHRCHPAAGLLPACAIKRARTAEETETGSHQGAVQRRRCPLCHPGSGCCVQGAMGTLAPCWRNGKLSLLSVNVNMYMHRHLLTATRLDGTNKTGVPQDRLSP